MPPDSRRPFLEEEIISEIVDDIAPDVNAIQFIHALPTRWCGLSLTQELADLDCDTDPKSYQSYEQHLVYLCTRANGITGIPEPEFLDRFVQRSYVLDVFGTISALIARLEETKWQVRCKALVLLKALLLQNTGFGGHVALEAATAYFRVMRQHPELLGRLHRLSIEDRNARVRDEACKLRSIILSGEENALCRGNTVSPERIIQKNRPPILLEMEEPTIPHKVTLSPRVAMMALASWKRKKQYSGDKVELGSKFDDVNDCFQADLSPAGLRKPELPFISSIFRV